MKRFLQSFYDKLSAVFLILLLIVGAIQIFLTWQSSVSYLREADQIVNLSLARNMAKDFEPDLRDSINMAGIEHSIPIPRIYSDALTLWAGSETYYTPTLVVGYGGLWGENYWYQVDDVWENPRLLDFVPRFVVDPRARRRVKVPDEEFNHFNNARICKELLDAGGRVQLGAHGQMQGLGVHWELWMFVQGGMTALEAIRAATLDGAGYLGLDGDLGSLEAGKLADLIVIDGNPLEDIRDSENVRYTMINGRLFDARTMDEAGNHPRKRGSLFWEGKMPAATLP